MDPMAVVGEAEIPFDTSLEPKRKKHRRGKKKPAQLCSCVTTESPNAPAYEVADAESPFGLTSGKSDSGSHRRKRRFLPQLRPTVSPRAPQNYTQFLIEDCGVYASKDSLDTFGAADCDWGSASVFEPSSPTAGASPDWSDFFKRNFDMECSRARADDLSRKSKSELIAEISALERKVHALQRDVSCLEGSCQKERDERVSRLLQDLANLTRQHGTLLEENRLLKAV